MDQTVSALVDFNFANGFILKLEENFKKTADPATSELTQLEKQMEAWASEFLERLRYLDSDIKKPSDVTRKHCDQYAKHNGLKKDVFFRAVERIKDAEFKKKL